MSAAVVRGPLRDLWRALRPDAPEPSTADLAVVLDRVADLANEFRDGRPRLVRSSEVADAIERALTAPVDRDDPQTRLLNEPGD